MYLKYRSKGVAKLSEVKWIKLSTTMFEDEKIRLIESMPGADSILIIWIKLLAQAGKTNASGYIYLNEQIPYTDEMLATIFNRPLNTVKLALQTFNNFGMIEITENDFIGISNWEKHQNVDGLEKIREQTRERVRRHREKKQNLLPKPQEKQPEENEIAECNVTETLGSDTGNVSVTRRNATDIELELELELERERERERDKNIVDKSTSPIPFAEIIEYLNLKANTKYRLTTKKTKDLISARFKEKFTSVDFKQVIDIKTAEWLHTDSEKYLRPETLFGNKFEGYLNQKPVTFKGGGSGGKNQSSRKFVEENGLPF